MRKILLLLAPATLLCSTSCKKEVEPQPPTPPKELEVVWKTELLSESGYDYIDAGPYLVNSEVLFYSNYKSNGVDRPLFYLDTADGLVQRTWSNTTDINYTRERITQVDNYILFNYVGKVTCLNASSNTVSWSSNLPNVISDIYEKNGYVYLGIRFKLAGSSVYSSAILRTHVTSGQWDTVYTYTSANNYSSGFFGCGFGNLPNGDEVMVWKNAFRVGSDSFYAQIFAFNLTADSLLWRSDLIAGEETYNGTLKVVDGVVYGLLKESIVALDLTSGTIKWKKKMWAYTNFNQHVDHFYIIDNYVLMSYHYIGISLVYLNTSNGEIHHIISGLPNIIEPYTYFEGKLWGSGGELSCIDIASGKNLFANYTFSESNQLSGPVSIDNFRRVLYTHDLKSAYCIKIPDL